MKKNRLDPSPRFALRRDSGAVFLFKVFYYAYKTLNKLFLFLEKPRERESNLLYKYVFKCTYFVVQQRKEPK